VIGGLPLAEIQSSASRFPLFFEAERFDSTFTPLFALVQLFSSCGETAVNDRI